MPSHWKGNVWIALRRDTSVGPLQCSCSPFLYGIVFRIGRWDWHDLCQWVPMSCLWDLPWIGQWLVDWQIRMGLAEDWHRICELVQDWHKITRLVENWQNSYFVVQISSWIGTGLAFDWRIGLGLEMVKDCRIGLELWKSGNWNVLRRDTSVGPLQCSCSTFHCGIVLRIRPSIGLELADDWRIGRGFVFRNFL